MHVESRGMRRRRYRGEPDQNRGDSSRADISRATNSSRIYVHALPSIRGTASLCTLALSIIFIYGHVCTDDRLCSYRQECRLGRNIRYIISLSLEITHTTVRKPGCQLPENEFPKKKPFPVVEL